MASIRRSSLAASMTFLLSRYKFAAKMLAGCDRVVEIGCGDGFGSRVVAQDGIHVTAIDFDPELLESARATAGSRPCALDRER